MQQDERVLGSEGNNLSTLHLTRVEQYVLQHLGDPELSPATIASACGLSLRYLHKLFAITPYTLGEWVRQQRLEAVHRQLRDPHCHLAIGELAFRWGLPTRRNSPGRFASSMAARRGRCGLRVPIEPKAKIPTKF